MCSRKRGEWKQCHVLTGRTRRCAGAGWNVLPLAGVNADGARLKQASRGGRITAELSLQYVGRVRKWLRACFGAPQISMPEGGEEDNSKGETKVTEEAGPSLRERTIMSLTCGENAIDRALAEIAWRLHSLMSPGLRGCLRLLPCSESTRDGAERILGVQVARWHRFARLCT